MVNDEDVVSVVIPAFNAAETLQETLNSVAAQSWRNLEIIVVDDGSTDATPELAESFAAKDQRARLIRKPNGGVAEARNAGVRASRGRYVAPIDADDLWHPEKITRQMRRMTELGPSCGYVYTLTRDVDEASRIVGDSGAPGFESRIHLRSMLLNFVGNGSALLIRREAFDDAGGYDVDFRRRGLQGSEDFMLQNLIARRWIVGAVDEWLTGYRVSSSSMSSNHDRMKRARLAVIEALLARYPETPPEASAAAEAICRALLCVVRLRETRLAEAGRELIRGLRLSPRVTLETIFMGEAPRLARALVRRALGRRDTGPEFHQADPTRPFTLSRPVPHARVHQRLAALEAASDQAEIAASARKVSAA